MPARKKSTVKTPKPVGSKKSKAASKKSGGRKYQALCHWEEVDLEELLELKPDRVKNVVFRGKEISFDWVSVGNDKEMVQTTLLSTVDGVRYTGITKCLPGYGDDVAPVEAVLYSNNRGHLLLGQGTWEQDRFTESFFIQLYDEKIVES